MKKKMNLKVFAVVGLVIAVLCYAIVLAQDVCPQCGESHSEDHVFCPKCGYKFSEDPVQPESSPGQPVATSIPPQNNTGTTSTLVITGAEPFCGPPGTLVVLKANGIDISNPDIYKVEFNGLQGQIINVTQEAISVLVPQGATTGTINVYVNGALVMNSMAFFTVTGTQGSVAPTPVVAPVNTPVSTVQSPTPVIDNQPTPPVSGPSIPSNNLTNLPSGNISVGKIIYTSWERKTQDDIMVLKAGGGGPVNLTGDSNYYTNPCWSPDGTRIAFTSTKDGTRAIYSMSADGSNMRLLVKSSFWDDNPSWSPDGKKIAFESWRDGNLEIYLMNPDGSGQVNITRNSAKDVMPCWSPDSSKIYFSSDRDKNCEIYVMKSDGSSPSNLTKNNGGDDEAPSCSPDGKKIVFHSSRDKNYEIYIMDANGSNQKNLSNNQISGDQFPCWSPDGNKIAFMSNRSTSGEETYWEICVMNSDGTNMVNITSNSLWDGLPDWVK